MTRIFATLAVAVLLVCSACGDKQPTNGPTGPTVPVVASPSRMTIFPELAFISLAFPARTSSTGASVLPGRCQLRIRLRATASPARARPTRASDAGSGTAENTPNWARTKLSL